MEIVARSEWEARPPKTRVTGDTVTETYLHHSAGPHKGAAGVRSIQNYHMDHHGWADIAYNHLIDPDTLTVYEGRGWGVRPGSQKSHNTGTWSVCILGDYRTHPITDGLIATISQLIVYGAAHGHIPLELTGGHRDAPGQSTTCPARLSDHIPTIRNQLEDPMDPELLEFLKDMYRSAVEERGSNGTALGYMVDHLRKHPGGGGISEAKAREIARDEIGKAKVRPG